MRSYVTAESYLNLLNLIPLFRSTMNNKDYSEIQQKFGEKVQKIRNERNLSLRAVASKCDIDDSKISKIENGKFNVKLSTILELAKGLGVSPAKLVEF